MQKLVTAAIKKPGTSNLQKPRIPTPAFHESGTPTCEENGTLLLQRPVITALQTPGAQELREGHG
jgi:hypothetical protein